jgi:hypothetical protein
MKNNILILSLFILLLFTGCTEKFVPVTNEDKELLVVQSLITDQPEIDTVKLSRSLPFGQVNEAQPVRGAIVTVNDNQGGIAQLREAIPGAYVTPPSFHGTVGLSYTLHIFSDNRNYTSTPMEMHPVPLIDSLYYEKIVIEKPIPDKHYKGVDGCQIYLDTHDPENKCRYFRWDFAETWILRLLFPVQNQTCWISDKSRIIDIKSTIAFDESRISRYPVNYITNMTDRLKTEYSILVNQYSLSEDEYHYWDNIQNVAVNVGGFFDIIPSSVPGNIWCNEDPTEKVLGYFSVSAKSSKRLFIKDYFAGIINRYSDCATDTIPYIDPPGLNIDVWILEDEPNFWPPFRVLTDKKGCADCTVRGSTLRPDFWKDK